MKLLSFPAITLFAILAVGKTCLAKDIQSKPFFLELQSSNASLNGERLFACHTGAAIEQPCILPPNERGPAGAQLNGSTFHYNYTKSTPNVGKLTFNLEYTGENNTIGIESEPMSFNYNPGRNLAGTVFFPDPGYEPISFDSADRMYILDSKLEVTMNPKDISGSVKLYRWHMCTFTDGDEFYYSLVWLLGTGAPSISGCQAVGVKRVFQS